MFGIFSEYYTQYLIIFGAATAIIFCIPLFSFPMTWGRLLMWNIPDDTDLAVYLGRCLGALGLVIDYFVINAALANEGISLVFDSLYLLFSLMIVIHIYGALRKIQPISETLEIGLWIALLILNAMFHPAIV